MKKIVIPCIISCALTISNTALGMLVRYCRPHATRAVTPQRKYNNGAYQEIMAALARQSRSLRILSDDLQLIKSALDKNTARQEHMAKLFINTTTNDPNKRAQLFHEFLKNQITPINTPKITYDDDFLNHEFADNRLHI